MKFADSARRYLNLVIILGAVFAFDWFTSYEVSVGPLYLLVVGYSTWQLGLRTGMATALVCTMLWVWADYGTGHRYSYYWILYENAGVRFFTYILIVAAVSLYKRTLEAHRRRLAMLERLLSVCPGCGAIGVNEGGWRKASQFHEQTTSLHTLCPTCDAAHQANATENSSRTARG